jgi:hypothetical protein
MPRRRNRQYQGYDYGYNQPSISQYESFFNPIPIEFLQQNLAEKQQKYDVAFQGAMGATDQLRQTEAAMSDLAFKNELVNKGVKDINKMVTEKYGGDWGRASKEVARNITQLRSDPFWQTTKYLKEQQELEQKFKLAHPSAHIYTAPSAVGAIDPATGRPRSMKELTFRGEERGDWQQSVRAQFADVKGSVLQNALKQSGVPGYMKYERIEDLNDTQLRALADHPAGVDAFLETNPDFERSKIEIEGLTPEQVRQEASDYIYGNIRQKAYRKETGQIVKDEAYFIGLRNKAAASGTSGIVTGNSGDFVALAIDDPKKLSKQMRQTKKQIDAMPAGPQKEALQNQYNEDVKNHEFVMHSVQKSQYAINFDDYYSKYVAEQEKVEAKFRGPTLSREEFEQAVYQEVGVGEVPEKETREQVGVYGIPSLITQSRALFDAGKALQKGMKRFVKEDGQFAINVNILGGETGRKDVETYVGRLNEQLTNMWNTSATSFTLPYTSQQIGTVLEEDRRFNGKKPKTEPRDSKRDQVLMTDGTMDGKVVYQLNMFDKEGNELGSEYIVPDNQQIANANTMNAAQEMMQSGDPNKVRIGTQIMGNVLYGPAVQEADIYNNAEGGLGVDYQGNEVRFEKQAGPTPNYRLYTVVDGEKDYFDTVDAQGNITQPTLTSEKEIQHMLMVIDLSER